MAGYGMKDANRALRERKDTVQKSMLDQLDISIEDMLNGRVEGAEKQEFVHAVFNVWNQKLGYQHFHG